jgi:prephenate dehydrogenase
MLEAIPRRAWRARTRCLGPGVHTVQGQRVVVCPGRGDEWLTWTKSMFRARGLVITETTAEEHDQMMAVVQVLNHFRTQVMGLALARLGIPFERTLAFTSPAYLLETYMTARHFAQDPALYGPIEMRNPDTDKVTAAFVSAASELAGVLGRKDQGAFAGVFGEVRQFFGKFTDEALEESRHLIDRVVELTAGRGE